MLPKLSGSRDHSQIRAHTMEKSYEIGKKINGIEGVNKEGRLKYTPSSKMKNLKYF